MWSDDDDEALADLDEAIRLDPECAHAYADRGVIRGRRAEYDKAFADLDEAVRLEPDWSQPHADRGAAWAAKGEYDKALAELNEAIRLDPENPRAYANRGGVWVKMNRLDKALADLDDAVRLEPRNAEFRVNRARVREEKGQRDKALTDLDEAIRLDPDNPQAHNGCAWIRATCPDAKLRDGKQAVAAATRACELTGWKEPGLLDTLAAACAESGDFDAAIRWQTKAAAMVPDGKDRSEYQARLKLYRSKTPYREGKP